MGGTDGLSDREVLDAAIAPLVASDAATLDALYAAFEPVDEARNAAALRMLAGAAVAFLSTFGILAADNSVSGLRIEPAFFSAVAVGYTTLCYVQLTDANLKRRLYERLFAQVFDRAPEDGQARIALLYPKAFPSSLFTAAGMKPRGLVIGGWQAMGLTAVVAGIVGSAAAGAVLWLYMLAVLWDRAHGAEAKLIHAIIVIHLAVVALAKIIHRDPSKRQRYLTATPADAAPARR